MSGETKPVDPRSSYKPEYAVQARKLCQLGATDIELADFFEVSDRTIRNWRNTHPDFAEALLIGKEVPDERVVRSLYAKAVGYSYVEQQAIKVDDWNADGKKIHRVEVVDVERQIAPDTTACIFWLKNRRRDEWRDKIDHEHTGKDGGDITAKVTVDAVLAALSKVQDEC